MGQKISVNLFRAKQRLSNVTNNAEATNLQKSVWFATGRSYSKLLMQDVAIRDYIKKQLVGAGLVDCIIRRYVRKVEINLFVTRPGVVIGKSGANINKLRTELVNNFKLPADVKLNIEEFKDPSRSAEVVANEIAEALKKNVPYRKLIKNYLDKI